MDVFDIVILGFDRSRPDSPAAGLQRVFPIDQGTAVRLINALPATVKRGVPAAAAQQYQAALSAIGARVELRKSAPVAPAPPAAVPSGAGTPVEQAVPAATPAVPVLGTSRFVGAATVKQGSPVDSVAPHSPTPAPAPVPAPASVPSPHMAASAGANSGLLPTERPPPPAVADLPSPSPAGALPVPSSAPAAPVESWGGFVGAPAPKTPAVAASENSALNEREANRQELFRRLSDLRQTGPAVFDDGAGSGISALELDLPPPREGWAAPNEPTLGADPVSAPRLDLDPAGRNRQVTTDPPPAHDPASHSGPGVELPVAVAPISVPPPPVHVYEPPADTRSFQEALPDAVGLIFREGGLQWFLLLGGVGLVSAVAQALVRGGTFLPALLGLASLGVMLVLANEQATATLRAVADDLGSPDAPDLRGDDLNRYLGVALNLLGVALVSQLPFLIWASRHRAELPGALTQEPLGLVWLMLGAFYWPSALGLSVVSESAFSAWSLRRVLRVISGAFADYATMVLATAIQMLLPLGGALLLIRAGLPAEVLWLGLAFAIALSHGTIGALTAHLARLHPSAFQDD